MNFFFLIYRKFLRPLWGQFQSHKLGYWVSWDDKTGQCFYVTADGDEKLANCNERTAGALCSTFYQYLKAWELTSSYISFKYNYFKLFLYFLTFSFRMLYSFNKKDFWSWVHEHSIGFKNFKTNCQGKILHTSLNYCRYTKNLNIRFLANNIQNFSNFLYCLLNNKKKHSKI